ncbi:MipA/OmpV family protein [Marinomonas atlantica]|uniref:MipA/OmpV family protein n=1 Tax=Marinomonas atlantica TaxID=1806668 RepID=UPI000AED4F0C|nr:MipA/OmpV family protein [Marinomonas atlantica]
MTLRKRFGLLSLTPAVLLTFTANGYATEWNASLGATGLWQQSHVVGEDDRKKILPYINLAYEKFSVSTGGIGFTQPLNERNKISALVTLRHSPIDVDDNNALRNFRERDNATELTLKWSTSLSSLNIDSSLATDISDKHQGYEAKVKLSKPFKTQLGMFIPAFVVGYQSDKLVDYYYGVSQQESSNGFAAYEGDDTVVSRLALTHIFPLGDHWQTITNVGYTNLGSGIKDSPIVERSDMWGGSLTVAYKF